MEGRGRRTHDRVGKAVIRRLVIPVRGHLRPRHFRDVTDDQPDDRFSDTDAQRDLYELMNVVDRGKGGRDLSSAYTDY